MKTLKQQLNEILDSTKLKSDKPHLLLHSCCAPCSSYVLSYLGQSFSITLLFFNPNITDEVEYSRRLEEQKRLLAEMPSAEHVALLEGRYAPAEFLHAVKGMEHLKEGGERCFVCYELRLREAAIAAQQLSADYFATTLSISPHKNSKKLDEIALDLEAEYGVLRLPSDFKKSEGYKRSIELSNQYGLYRQNWCGCPFSINEI